MDRQLYAIKYRLEHPETIPANSWYTSYRNDIEILLKKLEEDNTDDRRQYVSSWLGKGYSRSFNGGW